MKRKFGRFFVLAGALVLSAAIAPSTSVGSAGLRVNAWTTPHVLTMSDGGDITTLNPHLSQAGTVANLSELTMAWLIRWDEHNQPYPELATAVPTRSNGGVSKDGLSITYHLRRGVKWADGAPFDADDVVFSTHVVDNPANDEGGRFDQLARVSEPDKFTVVFHLKTPYSPATIAFFSSCCANPSILPKHLLARYKNINHVPYNDLPVGIGPFKFARWDRGKQVVLVANHLYWRGRPKLDKIVYKIVTDRRKMIADLRTHHMDMWYQFSGAFLAPIQQLPEYAIYRQSSYAYNHFDFNLAHPVVADPIVRRALRLALDRRRIVDTVEHGVGVVQDSVTPVNAPYFVNAGTTPYDPAKANAMLDAAGWVRGADGVREKNGIKLILNAAIREGTTEIDDQFAVAAAGWKQIGVALSIKHYPPATFLAPAQQGGIVYGGNWDVVTFAYAADPIGDFLSTYGCDEFPPNGANDVHWCDKRADAAMHALERHYERAERLADLKTMMRAFVDDVPSIVSYIREDLFAYNKDLKHYHPNNLTPFDNMMNVDI